MKSFRPFALAAVAALGLSGCVATVGPGPYYGGPVLVPPPPAVNPYRPNVYNLDSGQRKALVQGCAERYGLGSHRYEQCIRGERSSERALTNGCYERYSGNSYALRRCLSGV